MTWEHVADNISHGIAGIQASWKVNSIDAPLQGSSMLLVANPTQYAVSACHEAIPRKLSLIPVPVGLEFI